MDHLILNLAKQIRSEAKHVTFQFQVDPKPEHNTINKFLVAILNANRDENIQLSVADLSEKMIAYSKLQKDLSQFDQSLYEMTNNEKSLLQKKQTAKRSLNTIAETIQHMQVKLELNASQDNLRKMQAQKVLKEEEQIETQRTIDDLDQAIVAQQKAISELKLSVDAFRTQQAEPLKLKQQLEDSQKLIQSIYQEALLKDEERTTALYSSGSLFAIGIVLGGLSALGYFLPFTIAAFISALVGVIPAAIVLIGALVIVGLAMFSKSNATLPGDSNSFAALIKSLMFIGLYLGVKTYPIAYAIMPFLSLLAGVAAVICLGIATISLISALFAKSSTDDYFEKTLLTGLEKNGIPIFEETKLVSKEKINPYSLFSQKGDRLIQESNAMESVEQVHSLPACAT